MQTSRRRLTAAVPVLAVAALAVPDAAASTDLDRTPGATTSNRAAPGDTRAVAAASTQLYGGSTRPDANPIVLTVRGGRVVRVRTMYETPCGPIARTMRVDAPIRRSGRFTIVETTFTDAAGTTEGICTTPTVRWSAES